MEAFAVLAGRLPQARLAFVGHGPLAEQVAALARQLGLADRIELLGLRTDVPEQLASAACLLLTSSYEGCPLSVLDAMAAGAPVGSTRSGGTVELVEDGATGMLTSDDIQDIAGALHAVLSDHARAAAMGERAREAAKQYSLSRMVQRTEAVYDEVAGR